MATRGELRKALLDWKVWLEKNSRVLLPRKTAVSMPQDMCLALTGVRRSGKSSLASQLQKPDYTFYFNFEDPIFFSGTTVDVIDTLITLFEEEMGHAPQLVILDEVQNVLGWERWVRKAVDLGRVQVIVTGSSSQLLSSEIATAISGRVIEHTVWPLSFAEYLQFRNLNPTSEGIWIREMENYLRWGGFPKAILLSNENERIMLLKQYLSDIVLRDVVARHSIKNQHALNQLVSYYLMGLSTLHSYNALRKAFGISTGLAATLTSYLQQAFLVFEMSRYHHNLKVQARDPKKIYFIDTGLRTVSLVSERKDWGRLAENIVYLELRRRGHQIFYFKQKQEVDFVLTELGKPIDAIQVCYSDLQNSEIEQRETTALLECMEALKLDEGKILTLSYQDTISVQNKTIHFIPLYKWLVS